MIKIIEYDLWLESLMPGETESPAEANDEEKAERPF